MKIVIDQNACSGNGRCYSLAPELFTDDERGYGQVVGDGTITEEQRDLAQRAVLACPEDAITIE
jgi:ferredoxin